MSTPPPSPWLAGLDDKGAPLDGDVEADVAVVGGGYSGLCSALELRREGLDAVVLEAETAGFGASGRNAGHLTPTIGKDLPTLTLLFGRERVRGLVHLADTAIQYVEDLIRTHAIDCAYEPVGNVVAAVHERQFANLDKAAAAASEREPTIRVTQSARMKASGQPSNPSELKIQAPRYGKTLVLSRDSDHKLK